MNLDALFTVIRRIGGGSLTQADVDEVNAVLRQSGGVTAPTRPESKFTPAQTSKAGIDLIHAFEGYAKLQPDGSCRAYPDPGTGGKPYTIGWGSTTDEEGNDIQPGTVWSRARADRRFVQHLGQFERQVLAALGTSAEATSQPQFDALVSFAYNVGPDALRRSTLLRKHKAADHAGAAREFARWNRAGGHVLRGLTRRREAEAKLYRSGM